jgi:arylsulfatase A-like enzyme
MIDLMPTFCAATGTEVPSELKLDGANVLDVLTGKSPAPQRTLFFEWREGGNTQLAAMRGSMKLVINGGNRPELYDVEADPAERFNQAADHAELTKELDAELASWLATETDAAKERRGKDVKEE